MSKSPKKPVSSFWAALPRPLFVLAPMANVTDEAFRSIIVKYGKPDVVWTEFVSADGLMSPGRDKLLVDLRYSKKERPIVAQLFTGHPEAMKGAAALVHELGFDGLDINMGCPDRAVEKQGGGASLIKNPDIALEVIRAAQQGVGHAIPVTVKTRIGYNKLDMKWLEQLFELHLPAMTVHLRTRKEMSDVPAHWELMPDIVALRDRVQVDIPVAERTLIIGNGDVLTVADGYIKVRESGCDGVMIGRGIFGTPWLFASAPTPRSDLGVKVMLEHALLFEKKFSGIKNFAVMKKHFKAYISGWEGAKELRMQLMETENASQVKKIVKEYMKTHPQV